LKNYKNTWLYKYKHIPDTAHGFPTCMYVISLEAWRRGLKVKFNMKRRKSIMTGLSYSISNGEKEHLFYGSRGDLTTREANRICADKGQTIRNLKAANVSVPEGKDFPSETPIEELLDYAEKLGYPLVLKPSTGGGGGGVGVVINIKTTEEMKDNIIRLKELKPKSSLIIERFFVGEDFRVNVFNGKVIGAFHRRAQSVIGDGKHTLKELLRIKNKERNASPFLATSKIKMDKKMKAFLAGKDITPEFVPAEGERIYLRRNGEFFGQRDAINVTDNLSPKIKNIAVEAVNAIPGLSIGGVDMLIDLEKNEGIVNEVNSLPQISNHIFPIEGNAIDIPRIIIDSYFPETRYEELKNTHYYYDFKPIIENFRNGTAQEVTLPPIPTGKYIAKKYSVSGENFSKRYFEKMKKEAATFSINGFIKIIDDNNLVITISSKKNNLEKFQRLIKTPPFRFVKINNVQEKSYNGPIKVGFEIKHK